MPYAKLPFSGSLENNEVDDILIGFSDYDGDNDNDEVDGDDEDDNGQMMMLTMIMIMIGDNVDENGDDDNDGSDGNDDDGVYLKAVNINLRANLQIMKSVNLKYL